MGLSFGGGVTLGGGLSVIMPGPQFATDTAEALVDENVSGGTLVYTASAVNADSYALSGTDASSFTINSSTGAVTINSSPDHEVKSSYSISVTATETDGGKTDTIAVTVSIVDLNEAPVISAPQASYNLSTDGSSTEVTLTASDPEGDILTYSATKAGDTGAISTITNVSNVFTITPSTSASDEGTCSVTFTASDGTNTANVVVDFVLSGLPGSLDIANASYTGNSLDLTSFGTGSGTKLQYIYNTRCFWIDPTDDTKLHIMYYDLTNSNTPYVAEISLSTANDISSATGSATVIWDGTATQANSLRGMWEDDGNYWVTSRNTGVMDIWPASTPYDFDSLGTPTATADLGSQINGWVFNSAGTSIMFTWNDNLEVNTTSTAWNFSTIATQTTVLNALDSITTSTVTAGAMFNTDGVGIFVPDITSDRIYDCSTGQSAFDISGLSANYVTQANSPNVVNTTGTTTDIYSCWADRKQTTMLVKNSSNVLYQYNVA